MKKTLFLGLLLAILTSCYEDYVRDYDYSGIYVAYQYDLRTFVIGEGARFNVSVALGGVMENERNRSVSISIDDKLLTEDISTILPLSASNVYAIDGMMGGASVGLLSGDYVTSAFNSSGITALTPLPESYYSLDNLDGLTIKKGKHTASFTITAASDLEADSEAFVPYYAIACKIDRADADTVLADKSFCVVAVKCENQFYGYWRRSGTVRTFSSEGVLSSEDHTPDSWTDAGSYYLTTEDATIVSSNKAAGAAKEMLLSFNGSQISISSESGDVSGTGRYNGEKLLQNRELYLNYKIYGPDGSYKEVNDTLRFRNRIRDGISEWQDENPENY